MTIDNSPQNRAPIADVRAVTVVRHGVACVDAYGWLRDKDDPAVVQYLEAENSYAMSVLAPTRELQETLYREMLGRIKETDLSVPVPLRGYTYYTRTEEGLQYPIHCRRGRAPDAAEEVLVDLNALARGKSFMSLGAFAVSDNSRLLAYSTDDTGYRQYTLVVKNLESGEHLALRQDRVTSVAWAADDRTLCYTTEDPTTKRSDRLWHQAIDGEIPPGNAHEDRSQSDQRVKRRHQLRHRRHLDAPRGDQADRPADCDRDKDRAERRDVQLPHDAVGLVLAR